MCNEVSSSGLTVTEAPLSEDVRSREDREDELKGTRQRCGFSG